MNKKTIRISTTDINNTIKSLEKLSDSLKSLETEIPMEIAQLGLNYLNQQYASTPYDENIGNINTSISKTINGYNILASGKDVIYAEFGTGDKGESSPHKEKSKYGLNDYNSGKYIRKVNPNNTKLSEHGITSGKYWTYSKDGEIIYTQGIPAGMQMFNTGNYLRGEAIKNILDTKARDLLSKL